MPNSSHCQGSSSINAQIAPVLVEFFSFLILKTQPKLALNLWSLCFDTPTPQAGIMSIDLHAQLPHVLTQNPLLSEAFPKQITPNLITLSMSYITHPIHVFTLGVSVP